MKSQEYWRKRSEQIANRQFEKADRYEAGLRRQYELSLKSIQRDIDSFYARFAENNAVSMAEARRLLSAGELAEFKMTLSEFRKKAKNNADGQWTKELDNVYYRTRVTRLEALQLQVRQQIEMLAASQQAGTGKLLGDIYEDTYHRTLFEVNKGGHGILASFARADKEAVEEVISRPWYGKNYSSRIWENRDKLLRELRTGLAQSFIRGDSVDKVSKLLAERMGVSRSNAERLIQTESAHIINEATAEGYRSSGVVQEYEILATLDSRTSPICQSMDGKVFKLSEKETGVNYPPFHVRCRTTVMPYFDDEENTGKRIAKDTTGKRIYISGDMKYEDWKKEYIDSPKAQKKDILGSDEPFRSIMDKTEAPQEYKDVLIKRFSSGSETARRVFMQYVTGNVVKDSNFKQGAHYSPVERVVNMDFAEDLNNPRGAGATYFHELGHYVDNMAAIKLKGPTYDGVSHIDLKGIEAKDFKKAVLRDVQDYMQNYTKNKGVDLRQAQLEISVILGQGNGALHSAISDIYGGVTRRRIQGKYGHSPKYWQQLPNAIEKEAFAHMFEASFDPTGKRAELMREFLPKSFALFQKILEEI
ncbi:minor capsid protein [Paenibacillus lactis]|uniref:minor capsid protein n=1 Tax=Paenibacillus lactis TaxID=228574 RepID=UPI001B15AEF1|nr:minor capsid protein [Paenibacillus lactis]GIO90748.1 hypothetical protein J31TS3_19750 [Paenibacillus lactis]